MNEQPKILIKPGPGGGFFDGDEYHPILEKPTIIHQSLVVDLGISTTDLNHKPIPTPNNLAVVTRLKTAEQVKTEGSIIKAVVNERNKALETGIEKKKQLKRRLKNFRKAIFKNLKENNHPQIGVIMRCIDEGLAFEFMEKYHGLSMPIEEVVGLLVVELGSAIYPGTEVKADSTFEDYDDGRIYVKSGLISRCSRSQSQEFLSTKSCHTLGNPSMASASLEFGNMLESEEDLVSRPFSAGVRRLQPRVRPLRIQESSREYAKMQRSIIETSLASMGLSDSISITEHRQNSLHPTPSTVETQYRDVNNTPFLYPMPYSKSNYYDPDTSVHHLHTWNHNPVGAVITVAGAGFRSKSPDQSIKRLIKDIDVPRRKGLPPHKLPKLPDSHHDLNLLGDHISNKAGPLVSNRRASASARRDSERNSRSRTPSPQPLQLRNEVGERDKQRNKESDDFIEDYEDDGEDDEEYCDDTERSEGNDLEADRARLTKHSFHAENSRKDVKLSARRPSTAEQLEQRAQELLSEGIVPGVDGSPMVAKRPEDSETNQSPSKDKFGAKAFSLLINKAAKAAKELRFVENYFRHHNIPSGEKEASIEAFMRQDDGLLNTLSSIFDKRKQDAVANLKKSSEKGVSKVDATSLFDPVGKRGVHLTKKDLKDAMQLQNRDIAHKQGPIKASVPSFALSNLKISSTERELVKDSEVPLVDLSQVSTSPCVTPPFSGRDDVEKIVTMRKLHSLDIIVEDDATGSPKSPPSRRPSSRGNKSLSSLFETDDNEEKVVTTGREIKANGELSKAINVDKELYKSGKAPALVGIAPVYISGQQRNGALRSRLATKESARSDSESGRRSEQPTTGRAAAAAAGVGSSASDSESKPSTSRAKASSPDSSRDIQTPAHHHVSRPISINDDDDVASPAVQEAEFAVGSNDDIVGTLVKLGKIADENIDREDDENEGEESLLVEPEVLMAYDSGLRTTLMPSSSLNQLFNDSITFSSADWQQQGDDASIGSTTVVTTLGNMSISVTSHGDRAGTHGPSSPSNSVNTKSSVGDRRIGGGRGRSGAATANTSKTDGNLYFKQGALAVATLDAFQSTAGSQFHDLPVELPIQRNELSGFPSSPHRSKINNSTPFPALGVFSTKSTVSSSSHNSNPKVAVPPLHPYRIGDTIVPTEVLSTRRPQPEKTTTELHFHRKKIVNPRNSDNANKLKFLAHEGPHKHVYYGLDDQNGTGNESGDGNGHVSSEVPLYSAEPQLVADHYLMHHQLHHDMHSRGAAAHAIHFVPITATGSAMNFLSVSGQSQANKSNGAYNGPTSSQTPKEVRGIGSLSVLKGVKNKKLGGFGIV